MHIRKIARSRHWEVHTNWWGMDIAVFTGTLLACQRYVKDHS